MYFYLDGKRVFFPNQRNIDEYGNKGLEEERRLAYVGITRARRKLLYHLLILENNIIIIYIDQFLQDSFLSYPKKVVI